MNKVVEWLYGLKTDKILHFVAALLVAQVLYALLSIGCSKWVSLFVALLLATVISAAKEIWDIKHGVPSWKDFLASEIGVMVGLLVMALT